MRGDVRERNEASEDCSMDKVHGGSGEALGVGF